MEKTKVVEFAKVNAKKIGVVVGVAVLGIGALVLAAKNKAGRSEDSDQEEQEVNSEEAA